MHDTELPHLKLPGDLENSAGTDFLAYILLVHCELIGYEIPEFLYEPNIRMNLV